MADEEKETTEEQTDTDEDKTSSNDESKQTDASTDTDNQSTDELSESERAAILADLQKDVGADNSDQPADNSDNSEEESSYNIYNGIDLTKTDPAAIQAIAITYHSLQENLKEERQKREEFERKLEVQQNRESEYAKYQQTYGLSREEYDAMITARNKGDHFRADQLLIAARTEQERLQEQAKGQREEQEKNSFAPAGGSLNGNGLVLSETAQREKIVEEFKKKTAQEKRDFFMDNFDKLDANTKAALTFAE